MTGDDKTGNDEAPGTDTTAAEVAAADTTATDAATDAAARGEDSSPTLAADSPPMAGGNGADRPRGAGATAEAAEAEAANGSDAGTTTAEGPSRLRRRLRSVVEWALVIGGALLVAFLVKTFLIQAFWIPSPSMEPTLQRHDRVLANKLADGISDLSRGDVIVFGRVDEGFDQGPEGDVNDLIKRVVGLPGDVLEARDGAVYVNDQRLDEPYLAEGTETRMDRVEVPEGHVFVLGDNRGNSRDSRYFGPVPDDNIVGRAFLRIWPPNRIGSL